MRKLTTEEIHKLTSRKNVKRIAVENFLFSAPLDSHMANCMNLDMDARLYKWNSQTVKAIRDGLSIMYRG